MKEEQIVGKNKVIIMQYSLTNSEGVVVREAGDSPVTYLHGADTLFGKRNIDLVCEVPLSEFPAGENVEVGGRVTGTAEDGEEITFAVTDPREETVYLDGNHPLAGQSLVFEVEIQAIRNASDEETLQGKLID